MQQKPNEATVPKPVDWPLWLRTRPNDLRSPTKMFSKVDRTGRAVCLLCEDHVPARTRAEHHLAHVVDLDAWLDKQDELTGPKPDSIRRSQGRRLRRQHQLELAAEFDRDPYLYAVERVEVDSIKRVRPVLRRRLRHPKAETEIQIRDLHAQGLMRSVIADRLRVSEDYVRRVLKRLDDGAGVPENGASTPLSIRPRADLGVHRRGLPALADKPVTSGGDE